MKGLVKYLHEIYESCKIPFEVYNDGENIFRTNPDFLKGNLLENIFFIGGKQFSIKVEEEYKNSIKILEFCIKDKYRDTYNQKEKVIIELLQNQCISAEKIKEVLPQIKKNTFLITIDLREKLIEALEGLKNIYNDTEILVLNYENTIILIGIFEDITEHVSSINETICVSFYEKCYISYCHIQNYENLHDLYSDNIYKINLAKKYKVSTMIFEENSLLFEKIMDNLRDDTKETILNNFNIGFSKLDEDMVKTIEVFFKLDLNLSEASKALYVHRNTLIYRLDKIQKYTSYDIRKFNDAVLFKMAFFLWKQENQVKLNLGGV